MVQVRLPGSFRDPAGHIFFADGVAYRRIEHAGAADYQQLLNSGLYEQLVADGLLIRHEDLGPTLDQTDAFTVIRPEQLPMISYPYEWSVSQLRDAAETTLRAQQVALRFGMTLKDASAYNVQFLRGRPVLIDTLSFTRDEGGAWVAYRQFCQHFYAPLVLASTRDALLVRLAGIFIDGVPLPIASRLLPLRSRLRPGPLFHIHLHASAEQRLSTRAPSGARRARASVAPLVDSLSRAVGNVRWEPRSHWSSYYEQQESYGSDAFKKKSEVVTQWLDRVRPARVWDLGANTGHFSRIAARTGATVVAFDSDPACVEMMYRQAGKENCRSVLPLLCDLANPTPAIGWGNRERLSLEQRGPVELVLALALVHHLAVGNNVPLQAVASLLARLGRAAIVEFVPKSDRMVQDLLASRKDIFQDYHHDGFEQALASHFQILQRAELSPSGRILYLVSSQ
jgi:SAM-dependent methyltransferase